MTPHPFDRAPYMPVPRDEVLDHDDEVLDHDRWRPYEDSAFYSLDRLRHLLLPPTISRRLFFWPRINLLGISIPELTLTFAIILATILVSLTSHNLMRHHFSGHFTDILCLPLIVVVIYRSPLVYFFGISFERSAYWHGFLSTLVVVYSLWHALLALHCLQIKTSPPQLTFSFPTCLLHNPSHLLTHPRTLSGLLCILLMTLLLLTSLHKIRRRPDFRRVWLFLHHFLSLSLLICSVFHGARVIWLAFLLYLFDRFYAYVIQARFQHPRTVRLAKALVLPSGITRIQFPRHSLRFTPCQYMYVQLPAVSRTEYHAYTIASVTTDDKVVFLLASEGLWSEGVKQYVLRREKEGDQCECECEIRLHGPLGKVALDWQSNRYKMFVLVGGGIGVTPLVSMFRHLCMQKQRGRPLVFVELVWVTRRAKLVEDLVSSIGCDDDDDGDGGLKKAEQGMGRGMVMEGARFRVYISGREDKVKQGMGGLGTKDGGMVEVELNEGRPDLKEVFAKAGTMATEFDVKEVAVLASGPTALTRSVCKHARECEADTRFDVHVEHFF